MLLTDVEKRRTEITLLRRGVAIAKLVPIKESDRTTGFGWMRGGAEPLGDIVGPVGEEWDVDEE
jgi:antitoxin (DNA-binding transcriptional repressor) of toxin-antitoxin stability system